MGGRHWERIEVCVCCGPFYHTESGITKEAARIGRPGGWSGPAARMLDDPCFWLEQIRMGSPRDQFELECNAGVDPKSGHTGYFIPRRDLADIGPGTRRLSDVPCKPISPRVDKAYFHEKDVEIPQRPDTTIRKVGVTSWLDAARWNVSQLAKDMTVFT